MRVFQSLTLVATIVSIALAGGSVYTVSEINQAIITQFGEPCLLYTSDAADE